jgi:hypothetical protein
MGDPQRIRQAGQNEQQQNTQPIKVEGWESEDAYNDYLSGIMNSLGSRATPQMKQRIEKYVEMGSFGNLNNMLREKNLMGALRWQNQHGGQTGPDQWVMKGYHAINEETGRYEMVSDQDFKSLQSLQNEYNKTHKSSEKNYYKNSPTRMNATSVVNGFGRFMGISEEDND